MFYQKRCRLTSKQIARFELTDEMKRENESITAQSSISSMKSRASVLARRTLVTSYPTVLPNVLPTDPLATPKGAHMPTCQVCNKRARLICKSCSGTPLDLAAASGKKIVDFRITYCSTEHALHDQFHPRVCGLLREMKNSVLLDPTSNADRIRQMKQTLLVKEGLVCHASKMAWIVYGKGNLEQAFLAARFVATLAEEFLGPRHVETGRAEAHLALCALQSGDFKTAVSSLSKIEHTLVDADMRQRSARTSLENLYKLHGMLALEQCQFSDAVESFSEEVYLTVAATDTDSPRAACAFWRLGQAFEGLKKHSVTRSLFKHASHNFVSCLSSMLIDDDESFSRLQLGLRTTKVQKKKLDTKVRAQAWECLVSILDFQEADEEQDEDNYLEEMLKTSFAMSMVKYDMEDWLESLELLDIARTYGQKLVEPNTKLTSLMELFLKQVKRELSTKEYFAYLFRTKFKHPAGEATNTLNAANALFFATTLQKSMGNAGNKSQSQPGSRSQSRNTSK